MRVLVVNTGSSSLKLRVIDECDRTLASRDLTSPAGDALSDELERFIRSSPTVDAAGHRVVHGGATYEEPLVVDERADAALAALADLAPLHNPPALAAIHALRRLRPALIQVACFDTSFHAHMPARAATYALPARWRDEWGVRRFGFHGLSHAWASRRAAELLGRPLADTKLITAHLGAGASLAAVAGGRSVDTTMGFTPMEGLVMATRAGSVDPGAVLWALQRGGLTPAAVEDDLGRRSGLLGLSGRSGDLRHVVAGADAGDPACALAYEVYVYRIQTAMGAMAAALRGVDGVVFTGGAGEGSARLRGDVCAGLDHLGVGAPGEGPDGHGDAVLSAHGARTAVVLVHAREDVEIARLVRQCLGDLPLAPRAP